MRYKKMKRLYLLYITATMATASTMAQSVTYNHDSSKMNQFTVAEIGAGSLSPDLYYTLFHNGYRKSAAAKNKLGFRTLAGIAAYQQVDDATAMDSAMTKRAEIEALNVADRSGGALDVAWIAEGDKITSKLENFERNINRIVYAGGTAMEKERWQDYYNCFQCAVRATQDAYMPNSERKRQYLAIYADIARANEQLVRYLVRLSNSKKTSELLSASALARDTTRKAMAVVAAYGRWRDAGWMTAGND